MPQPKTLYDKIWDSHLVHEAPDGTCLLYIDRHLVHEVTSPQAFEGLRMAGRRVRAPGKTVAVPDHNVPTDIHRARGIENEESRIQVDTLKKNAEDFGIEILRRRRRPPGDRAHHRPGAGLDPAGHDHRLRRQPHRHARRLRGAGARDRHVRGGACAGHPDADPAQGEEHEGRGQGQPRPRRHRQGHHAVDHRRDRHRRRHRARHRVHGRGDPRALRGRPDDRLQHGDRGRRPRRADRPGRHDLRLRQGPPARAQGRRVGDGRGALAHALHRRGRALRPRGRARRRPRSPRS